ncbi:TadE/TadG family type IV pilus assembly protein [Massilia sp. R2A-15]|uniref:TadE/TadG family type IV pilus assembly protein n=1 Tax=Massilia sp. R2A-15 TaxID=3064278 RepID=UPI00273416B0|nr:TadE/TadG family type IV pilus assembly protein [Massilia sp. R2A-15]WLI87756.1 TadE/TadG family type IV pilus assembly protein [Massilia sp. R2A-15]
MNFAPPKCRGSAAVEFAILLPLLLLLALALVDIGRAIQVNLVLINLSREGANVASRGNQLNSASSQALMNALASTTPPLRMQTRGMIYISKIMGHMQNGAVRNVILEQYRWEGNSSFAPPSTVWNCGAWSNNQCSEIPPNPDNAATASAMPGLLADGEVIYAVETFYNFDMLFSNWNVGFGPMEQIGPVMYAKTIF